MASSDLLINEKRIIPLLSFTQDDLTSVNSVYAEHIIEWQVFMAMYEGVRAIKLLGLIERHERESVANHTRRINELYSFGYSRSVVNLFTYYLFKKEPKAFYPDALVNDLRWSQFQADCNLFGDSFTSYMTEQQRYAGVYGHVGILVDKPAKATENLADELKNGIYPYISAYHPTSILDWRYDRDEFNRPFLAYLKLRGSNGEYRLWWPDFWEVWAETEDGEGVEKIEEGVNPLREIPFVWLRNFKHYQFPLGVSDISDIAYVDLSIIRNLSQGEEVITYGAFPMLRKPYEEEGKKTDVVGATAVLGFDPEFPNSKPDWLEAKVKEPIDAVLGWVAKKVEEIYRASNAGGMAATEISTQAKSGVALKTEFQLLNAAIVAKAINLEKAEKQIIGYWLDWIQSPNLFEEVSYERSRDYDIQNLAQDLDNALIAKTVVLSEKFKQEIQKNVARQMLPNADEQLMNEIDTEIETTPEPEIEIPKEFDKDGEEEEEEEEDEEEEGK